MKRDIRTLDALKKDELNFLKKKTVCIVGVGGLGGYVAEMLARVGIGTIKVADKDVFDESNLNRQLLSTEYNLGMRKADVAVNRINRINSNVACEGFFAEVNEDNVHVIIKSSDAVIDCTDNIRTRFILQDACEEIDVPLIHGAVGVWHGQVSTVLPGDKTLSKIYGEEPIEEETQGTTSFLPAAVAAMQAAECIKVLVGNGEILRNKIMYIDVLNNQNFVADLNKEV